MSDLTDLANNLDPNVWCLPFEDWCQSLSTLSPPEKVLPGVSYILFCFIS